MASRVGVLSSLVSWSLIGLAQISCTGRSCTEIGCFDGAWLTLRTADGVLPEGTYTFHFSLAQETSLCEFRVPQDLPEDPRQGARATCTNQHSLELWPAVLCTEDHTARASTESCSIIEDRWTFESSFQGAPEEVGVTVQRDGTEIARSQIELTYQEVTPNGPECPPTCRQAHRILLLSGS